MAATLRRSCAASAERPFATVTEALGQVAPHTMIRVASGTFDEDFTLDDPVGHQGITIEGCGDSRPVFAGTEGLVFQGSGNAGLRDAVHVARADLHFDRHPVHTQQHRVQ